MLSRFRRWFWQPPQAHGEVAKDRTVSFLELFYDLAYFVVIGRAAHTLAENVSWRGFGEFAVIYGLIWIAWMNGTMYHDLHGRKDGRIPTYIFVQMLLLALLAVFTSAAAGDGGRPFALVYTTFLVVLTWLWYVARRRDTHEFKELTGRYLLGMVLSTIVIAVSVALPDRPRLIVWAVVAVAWVVGASLVDRTSRLGPQLGIGTSSSLVERFGLFTIIVLGEFVFGVVTAISETGRDLASVATGIIGLMIGFGIWWTYFDFVGRRLPRAESGGFTQWMFSHLPVTLSIAASGAALVSLIQRAGDQRAPVGTAWLLTGSVALGLVALIVTMHSLDDFQRLSSIYRPLSDAMIAAAVASLLAGWWRPAPRVLVLVLVLILAAVWLFAIDRRLRIDNPDDALPGAT